MTYFPTLEEAVADAALKTCPTLRYCVNESGVVQYREAAIYVSHLCLGPQCAAFRTRKEVRYANAAEAFLGKDQPPQFKWWCGLGGEPDQ